MDKWNEWYKDLDASQPSSFKYSDTLTYQKGFDFLHSCAVVEDWGCGAGGFKRFFTSETGSMYIGVDGSNTPFADKKVDLTTYVTRADGIYMRHVLEHNYEWKQILGNACNSFTEKLCVVLFTPFSTETREIAHNAPHGVDVPDMSFSQAEFEGILTDHGCVFTKETFHTPTGYGVEHIYYITKKSFMCYYTGFMGLGSNEAFAIPPVPSDVYDCYYYTNNLEIYEQLKDTTWKRRFVYVEPSADRNTSNMECKHLKACPHRYADLQAYTYTVWLDSKLGKLNESRVLALLSEYTLPYDMLLRTHPWIYGHVWYEVDSSMKQERYVREKDKILSYVYTQLQNGLMDRTDLHMAGGFILRRMNDHTREIGEEWYRHIQMCGIQDQISFFFVKQLFSRIHAVDVTDLISIKGPHDW